MKNTLLISLLLLLAACGEQEQKAKKEAPKKENLVEINGNSFQEWYPGKKQLKFAGEQDEYKRRHGVWSYYAEDGKELSMTSYSHGLRNGFTIVKYPNGALHYKGEYRQDKTVGVWTTYDENGSVVSEQDFGYPAE